MAEAMPLRKIVEAVRPRQFVGVRNTGGSEASLLLTNIGQLLTLRGPAPRRGRELSDLGTIEDAAVLCVEGKIAAVGSRREVTKRAGKDVQEVDCERGVALPGFVDSHTHPVFAEPRLVDFEKRIAGATYEQIA